MLKEIAKIIDGRQHGKETTSEIEQIAKENNIVIVFGCSDDLMEFRGAINDEVGCYDGGEAYITEIGIFGGECDCKYQQSARAECKKIEAEWCKTEEYAWTYKTDIPHECFVTIEEDAPYCRGIVFSLNDV